MSENTKKEIVKYCSPPVVVMVMGLVFVLISPVVYRIVKSVTSDSVKPIIVGSVTAVMGSVFFCLRFIYMVRVKNAIKNAETSAGAVFLAEDFIHGQEFLSNRFICGEHYIFSKGEGVILRLSEISEIIRETTYYRNVPTAEKLAAKMKNGKKVTVCSISQVESRHPPYAEIIQEMTKHAPDIQFIDKRH